jgi:hypothetical protein
VYGEALGQVLDIEHRVPTESMIRHTLRD